MYYINKKTNGKQIFQKSKQIHRLLTKRGKKCMENKKGGIGFEIFV